MGPVPEFINLFLHLKLRKMWIVTSLRSGDFFFSGARRAAGCVLGLPQPRMDQRESWKKLQLLPDFLEKSGRIWMRFLNPRFSNTKQLLAGYDASPMFRSSVPNVPQ